MESKLHKVNINDLPYSILRKIFSFLSVEDRLLDACLVCKLWHSVSCDKTFWHSIDFSHRRLINDEIILRSVSYSENVHSLNLRCSLGKSLTREGILYAISCCPNLRYLNIQNAIFNYLGEEAVIKMTEYCPNLETFKVHSQGLTDRAITNGIAKNLKLLQFVTLNQNRLTDAGAMALLEGCPSLSRLRLDGAKGVTDNFVCALAEREKNKPIMSELSLSMTGVTRNCSQYLRHLHNLTTLSLTSCAELNHDDVFVIVSNAPKIQNLKISIIKSVNDRCIEIVSIYLNDLRYIDIAATGVTDAGLEHLASRSKEMHRIDMAYTDVTHKGIEVVCENLPKLDYLGLLRCDKADDMEVESVIQRFPSIFFMTFLQESRRMLISVGKWMGDKTGIVTHEMIRECFASPEAGSRTKPRRIIGSGGKIEYVPFELPGPP